MAVKVDVDNVVRAETARTFDGAPAQTGGVNRWVHLGSVTVDLAPTADRYRNHVLMMDGWNDASRLHRPRPEVLDGRWTAPEPQPV